MRPSTLRLLEADDPATGAMLTGAMLPGANCGAGHCRRTARRHLKRGLKPPTARRATPCSGSGSGWWSTPGSAMPAARCVAWLSAVCRRARTSGGGSTPQRGPSPPRRRVAAQLHRPLSTTACSAAACTSQARTGSRSPAWALGEGYRGGEPAPAWAAGPHQRPADEDRRPRAGAGSAATIVLPGRARAGRRPAARPGL